LKVVAFIVAVIFSWCGFSQLQPLQGKIVAVDDVEGIHILNKTALKYTITDTDGSFAILTKANDTLTISSLKYETKELRVTKAMLEQNDLIIYVTERVNQLDEVVVGKIFTGSLASDLNSLDAEAEINAKDLGIPGFYGKPKNLPERKLHDADHGDWVAVNGGPFGFGAVLNMNKILNRISGRTKRLKERVILDEKNTCREQLIEDYQERLFKNETLTKAQQAEYFYFCMGDSKFQDICATTDFQIIEQFLQKKLNTYKSNLQVKKSEE